MTYGELTNFTYGELECLTYEELSMPMKDLLHKLVDENRTIPVSFYNKLCDLCDEINDGTIEVPVQNANITSQIKKPINLGKSFIKVFIEIATLWQCIDFVSKKFQDLFELFSDYLN